MIEVLIGVSALAFILAFVSWRRSSKGGGKVSKLPAWTRSKIHLKDGTFVYKDGKVDKDGEGWSYTALIAYIPESDVLFCMFRLLWVKQGVEVPFSHPECLGRISIKTEECFRWISLMGDRDFEGWWTIKMPLDLTEEVREFKANMHRASRGEFNFAVEFPVGPPSGERTIKIMSGAGLEGLFRPKGDAHGNTIERG